MPEVLLGLLRAPRQPRTKQDRHISAPSPDTGALQVLLGSKCLLSFHLGPCLHLKNQLSLCLIIQISFHSHQGSLLPSPCSWLCFFHLWEIQSFAGYSELARLDQKDFCFSGRGRTENAFLYLWVHFMVFFAGLGGGEVSEPPPAGRSAGNTSNCVSHSHQTALSAPAGDSRFTPSLLPGLMCWVHSTWRNW